MRKEGLILGLGGLALLLAGSAASPRSAQAGIGACGNIDVEARAMCEVIPPGVQCEGMCTPIAVRAACSAQLAAECRGGCDDLPEVSCHGECSAGCMADCEVDPGEFDCEGACQAECTGDCSAHCEAADNRAECMASCEGSCSASCDANCDVELPQADCEARCEASCDGVCEVDTNIDCQLDCQADGFAECEADVVGGCEIECEGQEGALFCDGEYVDHGDNLQMCIDALRAELNVEVDASSMGSASCGDGGCRAEGEARASVSSDCSISRAVGADTGSRALASIAAALCGLVLARRRRRA